MDNEEVMWSHPAECRCYMVRYVGRELLGQLREVVQIHRRILIFKIHTSN